MGHVIFDVGRERRSEERHRFVCLKVLQKTLLNNMATSMEGTPICRSKGLNLSYRKVITADPDINTNVYQILLYY